MIGYRTGAGKTPKGPSIGMAALAQTVFMSNPPDFTVEVRNNRDIVISKPEEGFEVTYRREAYSPMLIADDLLQNGFAESKAALLAQAWKIALSKAKELGWLDEPRKKRVPRPRHA
jgi:hypothetical protein